MQREGLFNSLSCSAQHHQVYYKQKWAADHSGVAMGKPEGDPEARARVICWGFSVLFWFLNSHRAESNSCPSLRTDHGGLLNVNNSSIFLEIQKQTQLRAPTICHLSPALSLQAKLRWDSAAAAICKGVSGGAMQKDDYSLVFTTRELGSIWISQQVKNPEEALFLHGAYLNCGVCYHVIWWG